MYSGKNQEQLMRNRMATRKEEARKRSIGYKVRMAAMAIVVAACALLTGVSVQAEAKVDNSFIITKEERVIEDANRERSEADKFVDKWINTNDYNDSALTYGHNFKGNKGAIVQELQGGWVRESFVGFDYTVMLETNRVNCEEVYTVYVIPTNDWNALNMESFDQPFLCYYESTNYSYVKTSFCVDLEDAHTDSHSRVSHIVK